MELLAQVAEDIPFDPRGGLGPGFHLPLLLMWGAASLLSFAYGLFWLWMLVQCVRSEPDWYFWLWLMVIVPFPGAIVYAVVRYYPSTDAPSPAFVRRWSRGRELARLETAAEQIGNPHQFIQWGDALRAVGQWDAAREAYDRALKKEPANLPALWGAALVADRQQRCDCVAEFTGRILAEDPQYKFGDVSLLYAKSLMDQGRPDAAREHLERHVQRWRHPEGLYRLATLCHDAGDDELARQYLRSLLQDMNASPAAIARKHGRWKSRARQLLRKLPKA